MSRRFLLGTAGHIDHGKTSLVRALTGVDADRLPEEKRRGMTIDIGFAELQIPSCRLGIVDVPGHERFIKNMLAGASAVDMALLVVAADDSVMPQTREHLAILQLLGVRHGVVALTKCDLREPDWLELVEQEINEVLEPTLLAGATIVRTSAPASGDPTGVDELRAALAEAATQVTTSDADELFRLCVDRVFSAPGRGAVVTGSISTGEVAEGDEVELLPAGQRLSVRGLQSHDEQTASLGRGARAAINLAGIHHTEISRGDVLATPGYLRTSNILSVSLNVLQDSPWPVKHRGRYTVHLGAQATPAKVYLLEETAIQPGGATVAQLHVAHPVAAVWGQPLILRSESPVMTLGGGRVLQPCARAIRRSRLQSIEQLRALLNCSTTERVDISIQTYGTDDWHSADLRRDTGLQTAEAKSIVEQLESTGKIVRIADEKMLHTTIVDRLMNRVATVVDQLHEARPLALSIPRSNIADQLTKHIESKLVSSLLDRLIDQQKLIGDDRVVRNPATRPQLTDKQARTQTVALEALCAGGYMPPTVAELADEFDLPTNDLMGLLNLSVEQGDAVFVSQQLFLDTASAARLRQTVVDALQEHETMTVAEIRDLLSVSRKYAVPICEYLDRCGITKRDGDLRRLADTSPITKSSSVR